jgi:hypothetical protein
MINDRLSVASLVAKDGLQLRNYPQYAEDHEIVLTAIQNNPFALFYSPLKKNKEMALKAVKINGLVYYILKRKFRDDFEFQDAIKNIPRKYRAKGSAGNRVFVVKTPITTSLSSELAITKINGFFREIVFIRDAQVALNNGRHLIPSDLKDPYYRQRTLAMLSENGNHFLLNKEGDCSQLSIAGIGFEEINRRQAKVICQLNDVSFRDGKTCIEGGNCFVFQSNGETKAIVGEISVILSFIALEENGHFKEPLPQCEPSEHAYRIARNLSFYEKLKKKIDHKLITLSDDSVEYKSYYTKLMQMGGEKGYRKCISRPVTESEKKRFYSRAKEIEAKLILTRNQMRKELRIKKPENLIVVPQGDFHLDLDLCVTPEGEVLLHDPDMVSSFLEPLFMRMLRIPNGLIFHKQYCDSASEQAKLNSVRVKILQDHKIPVRLLPMRFKRESFDLNYCNSLFLKDNSILIPAPTTKLEECIHFKFTSMLEDIFPHHKLIQITDMSHFMSQNFGGIRCLSFEEKAS